ncbi:MAG: DUF2202 domain-containing protein [Acidimicrobiales bacterium]
MFSNISQAETTHQEWVAELLDRYGIADPATTLAVGEFSDPVLQSLYDDLVARGLVSEVEALMVGALIEELDIEDLRDRASTNADIALVYAELERGSRNHLRAFVRQLDRVGVDYEPVYLDPDAYDAIVSTDTERGGALSEGSMHESGGHGNGGGQGHGNGQGQGNGGNGRRNG